MRQGRNRRERIWQRKLRQANREEKMLENYIALDLEMTGLNPKTDRILEIGAVKVQSGQAVETMSALIRQDAPLDPRITELTGITDEMAGAGEDLDTAMEAFLEFAGDLAWVGHNISFDHKYIKQWEVNHRLKKTHYAADTLKIARKCMSGLEKKTLDGLCRYFEIERLKSHRALEDAKAVFLLYEALKRRFLDSEQELFAQKELQYSPKRQTPATERQKRYLKDLMEYHKIVLDISLDALSRSEASRLTDQIISRHGKRPALNEPERQNFRP